MPITKTPQQHAICEAVADGDRSIVVNAGPGCGKTSTSVMTMSNSGYGYKLALAFAKDIAETLRAKAPPGVTVKTSHSAGLGLLKPRFKSRVSSLSPYSKGSKHYRIVQRIFPNKFSDHFGPIAAALTTGQDLMGYGYVGGHDPADWMDIVADIPLEADDRREVAARMPKALQATMSDTSEVTFSEMLVMPLAYDLRPQFPQNRIWGDEVQDWSPTQLELARRMGSDRTLYYGFGDRFQSIYAFRGADIHAVDHFAETASAHPMPLTTSFRCPARVIELARSRNPDLTVPDGTPDGLIDTLTRVRPDDCDDDTMVICRLNAPLFSLGMRFLAEGRSVRISTNLGGTLKSIIRGLKTSDMTLFSERLELWFRDQMDYANGSPHLEGAANDKYAALRAVANRSSDVDDMLNNIDKLTKGSTGPLLTTVHKAKGLEAPRVILLKSHFLTPAGEPYTGSHALTQDEVEQEWNIWFVAITRTMSELFFA